MRSAVPILLIALSLCVAAPARAQDNPRELAALDPLIGEWDTQATVTDANNVQTQISGHVKVEWTLGKRVATAHGADSSPVEYEGKWAYDTVQKCYRTWFFNSKGAIFEYGNGTWDESTKTLTFQNQINTVTATLAMHVADKNTLEWTVTAKNNDGKVLFNFNGKWTRKA